MREATGTSSRLSRALALAWLLASATFPAEGSTQRKLAGSGPDSGDFRQDSSLSSELATPKED